MSAISKNDIHLFPRYVNCFHFTEKKPFFMLILRRPFTYSVLTLNALNVILHFLGGHWLEYDKLNFELVVL